jgi:pyridoxamine 5'-phosphate oxidase
MSTTEKLLHQAMDEIKALIQEAERRDIPDANGASLATADSSGKPSVRIVYVQQVDPDGLVFFANIQSGKGQQIQQNPHVAICFFWPALQRQVIVEGPVNILPEAESDVYWRKRPRESQLAAWASEQSEPLSGKGDLGEKLAHYKKEFNFESAPRPPNWRAFCVQPARLEFWRTGWHQLRARTKYEKNADGEWTTEIENP